MATNDVSFQFVASVEAVVRLASLTAAVIAEKPPSISMLGSHMAGKFKFAPECELFASRARTANFVSHVERCSRGKLYV